MGYMQQDLKESLAPNPSAGRFFDAAGRTALSLLFALAFWSATVFTPIGSCTFVTFAFAGGFLIHLSLPGNKRWEFPAVIATGAAYAFGYVKQGGILATIPGSSLGIVAAFLGIGSLFVTSVRGIWESDPEAVKLNRANLIEIGSIPLLCILSGLAVSMAAGLIPSVYDPFLFAYDARLGFQPSYAMGRLFHANYPLAYASALAYNYLPIGLVALRIVQLREGGSGTDLRLIYASLGVAGFCLYSICPGVGPVHSFPGFPDNQPASMILERIPVAAQPRNAMPSLHVGWALLVFVNSWSRRRVWPAALLAALFLILTASATLGSGEHYLIDLVVAFPLTLAIQAAFEASGALRASAVSIGAGLTIAWLVALRTGALVDAGITPPVSWALMGVTLIASMAMHVKVARKCR